MHCWYPRRTGSRHRVSREPDQRRRDRAPDWRLGRPRWPSVWLAAPSPGHAIACGRGRRPGHPAHRLCRQPSFVWLPGRHQHRPPGGVAALSAQPGLQRPRLVLVQWGSRDLRRRDGVRRASVAGTVDVTASNVTVKDDKITATGDSFGVAIRHASSTTIQDCDISSPSAGDGRLMVAIKDIYGDASGTRVTGNNIWHTSTGVQIGSGLDRGQLHPRPGLPRRRPPQRHHLQRVHHCAGDPPQHDLQLPRPDRCDQPVRGLRHRRPTS